MKREPYFRELTISLQREGFTLLPEEEGLLPVEWNGSPLCRITDNGSVRYRREDVDSGEMEAALSKAIDVACTTLEYMSKMESAPAVKASGLKDGFRLLADFNGTVLAGKQTGHGANFVAWELEF